jgi:hypothetical protein
MVLAWIVTVSRLRASGGWICDIELKPVTRRHRGCKSVVPRKLDRQGYGGKGFAVTEGALPSTFVGAIMGS